MLCNSGSVEKKFPGLTEPKPNDLFDWYIPECLDQKIPEFQDRRNADLFIR